MDSCIKMSLFTFVSNPANCLSLISKESNIRSRFDLFSVKLTETGLECPPRQMKIYIQIQIQIHIKETNQIQIQIRCTLCVRVCQIDGNGTGVSSQARQPATFCCLEKLAHLRHETCYNLCQICCQFCQISLYFVVIRKHNEIYA